MIKKTSAVTTTVLGEVKIVGLLVMSAMLLGEFSASRHRSGMDGGMHCPALHAAL